MKKKLPKPATSNKPIKLLDDLLSNGIDSLILFIIKLNNRLYNAFANASLAATL